MALFLASAAGSSLAVLAGLRTRRRMFSSTSSTGLSAFLKRTKQSLFGGQSPSSSRRVHLVMGNEACDLDSLVSALVVAYMLEQSGPSFPLRAALATGKNPGQKEDGGQYQHDIFVPVVNIPRTPAVPGSRADIALRKDALGALAAAGVAPEDLLFVDDVDGLLDGLIAEDRLRVFLTDHNALASHQQSRAGLAAAVEGLIDHHKDEGKHPKDQVAYHNLEMVGSACTLVGELLQGADAPQTVAGDPTVARLLASVVMLDTSGGDAARGQRNVRPLWPEFGRHPSVRGQHCRDGPQKHGAGNRRHWAGGSVCAHDGATHTQGKSALRPSPSPASSPSPDLPRCGSTKRAG